MIFILFICCKIIYSISYTVKRYGIAVSLGQVQGSLEMFPFNLKFMKNIYLLFLYLLYFTYNEIGSENLEGCQFYGFQ